MLGSEGWWRCSLHGRHGLAPANRLQLLPATPAQSDRPTEPPAGHNIYQVPSVPKATVLSATYEKMEGWVQAPARGSAAPAQAVYQVPALAAQLLSERTKRSTHQVRVKIALKTTDVIVKTIVGSGEIRKLEIFSGICSKRMMVFRKLPSIYSIMWEMLLWATDGSLYILYSLTFLTV